ncbi:MAG: CRISPR-associated helicase Cas3' [Roseburia sp.]|nr:CRISPR-associated helicase Cas3' [Roseburia sp.]MCM1278356.1 CRISPR-associated helicase Cas3' [Robinsoniella sp.]
MKSKKIAHRIDDKEETIEKHLKDVAELAHQFALHFGSPEMSMADYAYMIGLAHDIGKYSAAFQEKINGKPEMRVDHSTAGAIEMQKRKMSMAAFVVAGHHAGIPNGKDNEESCLIRRLKGGDRIEDYSSYVNEISLEAVKEPQMNNFAKSFLIRMLYSALVDADFIQTEKFMLDGNVERGGYDSIDCLYERLTKHIAPWMAENDKKEEINIIRTNILKECLEKGKGERGLYSLTVPTGGGKTISSLAFALTHAKEKGLERIIYVIPYSSIIEQNAEVFRKVLGEKNVVEHHSNSLCEKKEEDDFFERHKLSIENWDAPLIVTTNVQFFDSLFANRVSKCRKLHNISNSIIIFDEAQMLPLNYLKPCVRAIQELVANYHATAVLCTATQPALNKWFEPLKIQEICEEHSKYFAALKRNQISAMGTYTMEGLIEKVNKERKILTIVNKKKTAQEIFQGLPKEGSYHLSTNMTPFHRNKVIKEIKRKLDNLNERDEQIVRVISTSLIEAGVDIDFPSVFREKAGIDSIVQAAGRCNREGKRRAEESQVGVFDLQGENLRLIEKNIEMTNETVAKFNSFDTLEAIQYYFQALQGLDEETLDQFHIIQAFESGMEGIKMPFKKVSEIFHLIDNHTKMLIIPIEEEARQLTGELEKAVTEGYGFKNILRKLGMYSVNLYEYDYERLINDGHIYEVIEGVAVLQSLMLYHEDMGLVCNDDLALMV